MSASAASEAGSVAGASALRHYPTPSGDGTAGRAPTLAISHATSCTSSASATPNAAAGSSGSELPPAQCPNDVRRVALTHWENYHSALVTLLHRATIGAASPLIALPRRKEGLGRLGVNNEKLAVRRRATADLTSPVGIESQQTGPLPTF